MLRWKPWWVLAFLAPASAAANDEPPAAPAAQATEREEQPAFDILEFRVAGNKLLKRIQVEEAIYPFMGKRKTIADVEAARARLEAVYQDRGYLSVTVDIPEQQVTGGVVTLKVNEAPVGRLRITGSRYYTHGRIRETVPSLAEGNVPDFNAVQRELAQLNRTGDRRITPVLKPSEVPGMVDVELKVDDRRPLHGSVELNNRYSANTSPLRALAQVRYDNLFQRDQSLSAQFQTAPENIDDSRVWSLSYVIPTASGTTWAAYAVRADSNVAALSGINVIGNGSIYGVRRIQPLPTRERFFHSLTFGADYKNFKENVILQGADTVSTPVAYAPLSAQYSATWVRGNEQRRGTTVFDAGTTLLLRGLIADREEFINKRYGASTSFITFRTGVQHEAQHTGLGSLFAKGDVSFASGPLISNEQYAAGGLDTVRGYTEFECLGDTGGRASLEARKPFSLPGKWKSDDPQSRIYAFFDTATLRIYDPLPGQRARCNLASAGVGMRYRVSDVGLGLDLARAFEDGPVTRSGDVRLLFRASYDF